MSVEENLKISTRYHNFVVAEMDEILTGDFLGGTGEGNFTWDLAKHKESWSGNQKADTILEQFGSGDKVCTRFRRNLDWKGKNIDAEALQIKTFRDGKICHIWEYWNAAPFLAGE